MLIIMLVCLLFFFFFFFFEELTHKTEEINWKAPQGVAIFIVGLCYVHTQIDMQC